MKKLQKLMVVGTTLGLGATIISPVALAASIELTAESFSGAAACAIDNYNVVTEAGKICSNEGAYWLGDGEYVINENVSVTGSVHIKSGKLTINSGNFAPAGGSDGIYLYNTASLEVNGGTIGSTTSFSGITAETDYQTNNSWTGSLTINSGTIKGKSVAIALQYSTGMENRVKLKGGTLSGENPNDFKNVFAIMNYGNSDIFDKFLVSGYHYTNTTKYATNDWFGMPFTSLGGTSTSIEANATTSNTQTTNKVSDNKKAAMEEMSREMEKVIAKGTSKGPAKKVTTTIPKAPDTGVAR